MSHVVILGAGHNGLAAAFYLARAGLDVEIVEATGGVGGACKTEELIPGYQFSTCANYLYCLRPRVLRDMRLLERGLEVLAGPYAHVLEGNRSFVWWPDKERLEDEVGRLSRRDIEGLREWQAIWDQMSELIGPFLLSYPPTYGELRSAAEERGVLDLLDRVAKTSFRDLVDSHFESPEMRSVLLPQIDSRFGASSLHPALVRAMWSYSETGVPPPHGYVKGGMGRLTELMCQAAEEAGATVRFKAPANTIVVKGNRVVGVELISGEQIPADVVVSNADLKRTMLSLIPREAVSSSLADDIGALRSEVSYLKFHCALSEAPEYYAFRGSSQALQGGLALVRSREHLEQSWASGRQLPEDPAMEQMVPSVWDPSLAPPGHHTVSFFVFGPAPRTASRCWEDKKGEMTERLVTAMDQYSPNFRRSLVDSVLFMPEDLAQRVLLTDGNIHHLDFDAGQLLARRPCAKLSRYRAPIDGLYLCGSGQHPGGEVTAAPGHNAAHAVLEDLRVIEPSTWQQCERAALS